MRRLVLLALVVATCTMGAGLAAAPLPGEMAMLHRLAPSERMTPLDLPGAQWFECEWAVIVTADEESAVEAAAGLRAAIAAFHAYFGLTPGRGAVLQPRYGALYPALVERGFEWTVPWTYPPSSLPVAEPDDQAARLARQLIDHGLAEPQRDLAITLRWMLRNLDDDPHLDGADPHHIEELSAFRHEAAHALFLRYVYPSTRPGQYGGDAPDWLDEAAALIAETGAVTKVRRGQFLEAVRAGRLPALSAMLVAEHPLVSAPAVQAALNQARQAKSAVPIVIRLAVADIGVSRAEIADFYASARGITDYLVARSGDQRILAKIARAIRDSGDPLGWVGSSAIAGGLPRTLPDLDRDFAEWSARLAAGPD